MKTVKRNESLVCALMYQTSENLILTIVQQKCVTITQISSSNMPISIITTVKH